MRMQENEIREEQEDKPREQNYPEAKGSPQKRKAGMPEEKPPKRARANHDMRRYITCKR